MTPDASNVPAAPARTGRYLRVVALWALSMVAAIAGFCFGVDPYGIFGVPAVPGLTARKLAAAELPRLSKPYRVEQMRPTTLVFGSSSTAVGIDPESPAWGADLRPVYNLGLDGSTLLTSEQILRHALVRARPRLVVYVTSFEDCLSTPAKAQMTPELLAYYRLAERLRVRTDGSPNPGYALQVVKDKANALLSVDAARDSLTTVLQQNAPLREYQDRQGFSNGGPLQRWTRDEGGAAVLQAKDVEKAQQFIRWVANPIGAVAPVARMADAARQSGARVVVVIAPSYVDMLELQKQLGVDESQRAWKMALTQAIAAENEKRGDVTLWDFTGVSPWTSEPYPARGPGIGLRWFWDTAHFRRELGTMLIERIEGRGPAGLGTILRPDTVAATIERHEAALRAWEEENPASVARVSEAVATAARRNCGGPLADCPRQPAWMP